MIIRLVELVLALSGVASVYAAGRPNILFLMTDDQDTVIGGLEYMPLLKKLLMEQGTTFTNYFVHTPVCCPSRASILTGRYLHNIPITNNSKSGNCYGANWRRNAEKATFAVYAKNAGYQTAFAGKYLNAYKEPNVPPGWDRWMGLIGNTKFYDYSVYVSNKPGIVRKEAHGRNFNKDYFPNVIINHTLQSIRQFSQKDAPFLVMVSWPGPHGPITPAPQDLSKFPSLTAPRTPNWNSTDAQNAKKHWYIRQLGPITTNAEIQIDDNFRGRQQSLQTVDRHIRRLVTELSRQERLNNTLIIYTSDNGFQLGQHRKTFDKRQPYEHDIRVPMVMRGPGVPQNAVIDRAVLNIDLAPTIVQLVTGGRQINLPSMDGQSIVPLLRNATAPWRSDFLVSYYGEGYAETCGMYATSCTSKNPVDTWNNTFHCLRSHYNESSTGETLFRNTMYCRFADDENFVEYYNLTEDPWQLDNTADALTADEVLALGTKLGSLRQCKGNSCRDFSA